MPAAAGRRAKTARRLTIMVGNGPRRPGGSGSAGFEPRTTDPGRAPGSGSNGGKSGRGTITTAGA
jgi:hypothetical protein